MALLRAEAERTPPPVAAAGAPLGPSPAPQPAAAPEARDTPPPLDDPVWDALVAGHLRSEVERMGYDLAGEQEQRLMDRLRDVREAGARIDEDPGGDPLAGARQRLSRSIVLLEADRAFREELGMGLGAFLRRLDGGAVDEVGPGAPPPAPDAAEPWEAGGEPSGMAAAGTKAPSD